MKRQWLIGALLVFLFVTSLQAFAQDYAPPPVPAGQILTEPQLEQMLGPIALYPDPLIAQILPACTQPAQIAIAYAYINSGGDANAIEQQSWDPSVKAVAHYPDVLKMLNDNMAWTTELGQAYINQPSDVMNAIQSLRQQAQQQGNLQNIPQDNIVQDDGDIEILPANPDMLYVPTYDPSLVFYSPCYGRPWITFGVGYPIGGWLIHDFDWRGRRLITWGPGYPRPAGWWRGTPAFRRDAIARAPVWRAPARPIGRPVIIGRGDRGYIPAPRGGEVRPAPHPVEVRPAPRPVEARPAPRPVEVRPEPARIFVDESARDTRAASARGSESRGIAAPARGGGGGGGGRKR